MSEIDYKKKVVAGSDALLRELDGEAVILNLGDESYYGLNATGLRMWQALTSSESIESAFQTLKNEFEVDETTLQSDLDQLIQKLLDGKMITLS